MMSPSSYKVVFYFIASYFAFILVSLVITTVGGLFISISFMIFNLLYCNCRLVHLYRRGKYVFFLPLSRSLQCRRFLRARECFARKSAMLKLEKRGENGASQKERDRGREERRAYFFSPLPLPPSFFRPSTYP